MTSIEIILNNHMKDNMRNLSEEKQLSEINDRKEAAQMSHKRSIVSLQRNEFKDFINFFKTETVARQLSKASCNGIESQTKRLKCVSEAIHTDKKYDNEYLEVLNKYHI